MRFLATTKIAFASLRSNLLRSFLTILGIIIGVLSIVLIVALGQGAQDLILSEFEGVGATAVILRPGKQPTGPADFSDTLFSESIKDRDIEALRKKENVPNAVSIDPSVIVPGAVSYGDELYRPTTFGWTATAIEELLDIQPESGEFFTADDIRERAKVAVIGSKVKEELFGDDDPIGQSITIRNHNVKVIGTFPSKGQLAFFNIDEVVLLPYTTAQRDILAIDYYQEIFIRADSEENINFVVQDVEATMREQHNITDPEKDDFFVNTQKDAVESISTVTDVLTIFLVAIASIALVVGGIGIMNIMLVSVTERTKEIGLRKAVGATNRDILTQFLIEAVMLTVGGGLIGTTGAIALAALAALVIRQQFALDWPLSVPFGAIALGIGVASAVGLAFGLYPARQASRKHPIEALRYE
ncbi:MAG: ABC transporter permease [Candidatus Andersenbacteria bacterium]|nr:ABC transporter permease [Candidatus Andersenbacteria bacterium]MBI3250710.1 ABC transporter permease [Candidatus Andersenbacteria bacterium]